MTNYNSRSIGVSGPGRLLRTALGLALAFLLAFGGMLPVLADTEYPKPTNYIADDAVVLSESTVREIKDKNDVLFKQAKAVIAVCTVKTTDGVDIGKYARSVYTEWKLPSGVLILIAAEDNAFYLVQSASISDVVTNEALEEIRDRDIEADFSAGNIDRAVRKAVSQLSILMLSGLKPEEAEAGKSGETADGGKAETGKEETKQSSGNIVVRILKFLLYVILGLVLAFVILFVIALFSDDVADFMRVYIFRRGSSSSGHKSSEYYDDRLYEEGQNSRNQHQNRPRNGNGANRPNRPPQTQQQYPNQQYPNQQVQNQQYPNQQVQQYPQQYPNQQVQYQQQYPNQQVQQYPQQYPNQQVQQYPQQYPNRQVQYPQQVQNQQYQNRQVQYPQQVQNQQYQNRPVQYQQQTRNQQYQNRPARPAQTAQPYSAENDPNAVRQKQGQPVNTSDTQTYHIPGRRNNA